MKTLRVKGGLPVVPAMKTTGKMFAAILLAAMTEMTVTTRKRTPMRAKRCPTPSSQQAL